MLTLMLFVALMTIGSLALVQNIEQQIKRDREEELIHRGVQYSRAVQHYFRKFGRYPNRIEDLENANGYRSLRRRYKDPITGKDFKPLHMTDVQMSFIPVAGVPGGGLPPGGLATAPPGGNGASAGGDASAQDSNSEQGPQDANGGGDQGGPPGANAQNPGLPGSSNSLTSQTFGGAPIVGVASTSKDKSIREFNKKDHYNQWQFIYDQTSDRGGLLMTPNQPPLKGAGGADAHIIDPGTNGGQQSFGQNPAAGQQPGSGNSPMQPNPQPPDQ